LSTVDVDGCGCATIEETSPGYLEQQLRRISVPADGHSSELWITSYIRIEDHIVP
jgi:hypothetical protein